MVQLDMPVEPKKAATVILVRDDGQHGFRVFLLRRHGKSAFMAGTFVYPGGKLEQSDYETALALGGETVLPAREWAAGAETAREEMLASRVAGLRELFEEAGVLLARRKGRGLCLRKPGPLRGFGSLRAALRTGAPGLAGLAREERLTLAVDDLLYYARWITPEASPIRFDTHFFLARHPAGQEAVPDFKETTEGVWMAPGEALRANEAGSHPLSPPTVKTVEDLSRFETAGGLFSSLTDAPVRPVLPVQVAPEGRTMIVFPWDRDYEDCARGMLAACLHDLRPSGKGDRTTRVILSGGRWLPFCKEGRGSPEA